MPVTSKGLSGQALPLKPNYKITKNVHYAYNLHLTFLQENILKQKLINKVEGKRLLH